VNALVHVVSEFIGCGMPVPGEKINPAVPITAESASKADIHGDVSVFRCFPAQPAGLRRDIRRGSWWFTSAKHKKNPGNVKRCESQSTARDL